MLFPIWMVLILYMQYYFICTWCGNERYIPKFTIGLSGNCFNWQLIHINMQSLSRTVTGGKTSTGTFRKHMDQRHSILLVRSKKLLRNIIALTNLLCWVFFFFGFFWHVEKMYDLVGSVLDKNKKAVKCVFLWFVSNPDNLPERYRINRPKIIIQN